MESLHVMHVSWDGSRAGAVGECGLEWEEATDPLPRPPLTLDGRLMPADDPELSWGRGPGALVCLHGTTVEPRSWILKTILPREPC